MPLDTTYYTPATNGNAIVLIYNPKRIAGTLNFTKYVKTGNESRVIDNADVIADLEFMVYGVNPSTGQLCYIGASGSNGEYTFASYGAPLSSGIQAGTVFKLSASGTFKITGLDEGLYHI